MAGPSRGAPSHLAATVLGASAWALSVVSLNQYWKLLWVGCPDNAICNSLFAAYNATIALLFIIAVLAVFLWLGSLFAASQLQRDVPASAPAKLLCAGYALMTVLACLTFIYRAALVPPVHALSQADQQMIAACVLFATASVVSCLGGALDGGGQQEMGDDEEGAVLSAAPPASAVVRSDWRSASRSVREAELRSASRSVRRDPAPIAREPVAAAASSSSSSPASSPASSAASGSDSGPDVRV